MAHQSRLTIVSELQGLTPLQRLAINKCKQHSHPLVSLESFPCLVTTPSTKCLNDVPLPPIAPLNPNKLLLSKICNKVQQVFGYRPCFWQLKVVCAILKRDKDGALIIRISQ
jgi:hypothetical protein